MTVIHDPGGNGFRIERVWAFLAAENENDEGIVGMQVGTTMFPMVTGDPKRVNKLFPVAERIARNSGKRIVLARFERRVDLDRIDP